jgi:hypothetical protein
MCSCGELRAHGGQLAHKARHARHALARDGLGFFHQQVFAPEHHTFGRL